MNDTPAFALQSVLDRHRLEAEFSEAVMREVAELVRHPGIDDPELVDLTHLPFCTIDYQDSLDLDQAMYICRGANGEGYVVYYALADAAHYVRPGMALFTEALRRGVSIYLPRRVLPMLPAELSEGIVSLNPRVQRRAVTFVITLDAGGQAVATELLRARVLSRAKLTYDGVQSYLDAPEHSEMKGQDYSETLDLLVEVGQLRMEDARRRDVVYFNRQDVEVDLDAEGHFCFRAEPRNRVSRYNEQVSLLCNIEGARLLMGRGPEPHVQPVFRIHDPPTEGSRQHLARVIRDIAAAHGLDPATVSWRRGDGGESLGDFLDRLRAAGLDRRVLAAMERQALITNQRSLFSAEPGHHFALGVKPYARFSAPMREIVGIFTHKEALEKLGLMQAGATPEEDEELRLRVISAANAAKERQRRVTKDVSRLALDQLLRHDLSLPTRQRPVYRGTILGMSSSRLYVSLDDPPVELKVYQGDLERELGQRLRLAPSEVEMRTRRKRRGHRFRLGDEIRIRTAGHDKRRDRWRLAPVMEERAASSR